MRGETLTLVQVPGGVPPLVVRAGELAGALGFPLTREEAGPGQPSACLPDVGRFLAMLAARCRGGRIAEIGTGAAIGTAWMASAMPADCVLVTTEIDQRLAAAAAELLATDPRVEVLAGDAAALLPARAPFDLLFADGSWHDPAGLASLTRLLGIGGHIVMDDVTPRSLLPADSLRRHDAKREYFFGDQCLISAEVVLPDLRNSVLVGTRHS